MASRPDDTERRFAPYTTAKNVVPIRSDVILPAEDAAADARLASWESIEEIRNQLAKGPIVGDGTMVEKKGCHRECKVCFRACAVKMISLETHLKMYMEDGGVPYLGKPGHA